MKMNGFWSVVFILLKEIVDLALAIYFKKQNRISGLMFLLNITLRIFTVIEFIVRQALQKTGAFLSRIYDGKN